MWSYYDASQYLSRGRKKHERPLYDRGLRIWKENKWDPNSPICIGWDKAVPLVTYNQDNSVTIQATQSYSYYNSLRSYSVRFTIARYSGIKDLFQRNFKFYIVENDARRKPKKEQGCRQCKQTGKTDVYCYADMCWSANGSSNFCSTHGIIEEKYMSNQNRWHLIPCEHGFGDKNNRSHVVPQGANCDYCNGTKRRMYGGGYEHIQWDGSPLRLKDGNLIKAAATLLERMVADFVQPIN